MPTNQPYCMKLFLLLIVLIPLFVLAQQDKPQPEDYYVSNIIKPKGNVKSVTQFDRKLFDNDSAFYKTYGYINTKHKNGNDIIISTVKYFPDGRIETKISKDSIKQITWHTDYVYDLQNNITEVDQYFTNGSKHIMISFHYDSLGRWIETRNYDIANNPYIVYKRIHKKNYVEFFMYYKDTLSHGKVVFEYHKNQTTKFTYNTDNVIYEKFIEKINGHKIHRQTDLINPKDGNISKQDTYQSNEKEGSSSEISYRNNNEFRVTRQQWNYNENGDITTETIFRSGFAYQSTFHNGTLNKTYEYIYDSHGNYIRKTEYFNGIPAYETTRTIEYYD